MELLILFDKYSSIVLVLLAKPKVIAPICFDMYCFRVVQRAKVDEAPFAADLNSVHGHG